MSRIHPSRSDFLILVFILSSIIFMQTWFVPHLYCLLGPCPYQFFTFLYLAPRSSHDELHQMWDNWTWPLAAHWQTYKLLRSWSDARSKLLSVHVYLSVLCLLHWIVGSCTATWATSVSVVTFWSIYLEKEIKKVTDLLIFKLTSKKSPGFAIGLLGH